MYSTMRSLTFFLFFVVVTSINPERSNGAVPLDALWHIKMMSPPLDDENSIRMSVFANLVLGCGDYSLCIDGKDTCMLHSLSKI